MTPSHQQKHQAGRHLAVAEALLRGYPASIAGAQTFIEVNGGGAVVSVAAQGAWQIDNIDKFTKKGVEIYVLVDVTDGRRDFYVVPGDELRRGVAERHAEFLAKHDGTRPRNPDSRHAAIEPAHVESWKNRWVLFEGHGPGSASFGAH